MIKDYLSQKAKNYPVISFVVLCYLISWTVWFLLPVFVGREWVLLKICLGIGMGPGLAAVILDRVLTKKKFVIDRRWISYFAPVFLVVLAICLSMMATGEVNFPEKPIAATSPVGFSVVGVIGSILSSLVTGFIFACAATGTRSSMNSINKFKVSWVWWILAFLLPIGIFLTGHLLNWITGVEQAVFITQGDELTYALYTLRAFLYTLLIVGIGEETGWRGFMLPELQKRFSPLKSAVILGLIWGFWHFPLFINGVYEEHPIGILGYLIVVPLLSIIITWLFNSSHGSLIIAIVFHAMINNTDRIIAGTDWNLLGIFLTAAIIAIFSKMWRRN